MSIHICENCGKEHDGSYGSGRFCSEHCRRSFCGKQVKPENRKTPFVKGNTYHRKSTTNKTSTSGKKSYEGKEGGWTCSYCGEVFRTRREKQEHTKLAHPERANCAWNKGLTKETNNILAEQAKRTKEKYKNGTLVPHHTPHTPESKLKLSKALSINNKGGRAKWYDVFGQKVQGTWERDVAILFENDGIKWEKVKSSKYSFLYTKSDGTQHFYTPDFWLENLDLFVEVKGYWWGDDKNKMKEVRKNYPNLNVLIIDKSVFESLKKGRSIVNVLDDKSLLLEKYVF